MNNKPVNEFKVGRIRAAVWSNESEAGRWHSVTFSRLYKDQEGNWKDSASFSRDDLPLLIKAADQAHTFLYQQPPESEPVEP
jgi:hypothetical protein